MKARLIRSSVAAREVRVKAGEASPARAERWTN
jgi:hypothetical protein